MLFGKKIPKPPLHWAPWETVLLPFRFTTALFEHKVWSILALTVGAPVKVKVTTSLTALQFPFPVVVIVNVVLPDNNSAGVGLYVGLSAFTLGEYVPFPLQITPVAKVFEPDKFTCALFSQTVCATPASTVGDGVKLTIKLSLSALQTPFPVVVRVKTTFPEVISAGVGL